MSIYNAPEWHRYRIAQMADALLPDVPDPLNSQGYDDQQQNLHEILLENVATFGKMGRDWSEAYYQSAAENNVASSGLRCDNCWFFQAGTCEIVEGAVDAGGVCRFYLIPEQVIQEPD